MAKEPSCRKCGTAWPTEQQAFGHEARCKGIPGLLEKVGKIQSKPSPGGSLEGPFEGPQGPRRLGSTPPAWAPAPFEGPSPTQLLEARVSILEKENELLKQVLMNDLQHLGQPAPPPEAPSPLPWLVLGGVVVLGGLWAAGAFGGGEDEREIGLGDGQRRAPSVGGAIVGKLVDKAAGKILDRALGKIL